MNALQRAINLKRQREGEATGDGPRKRRKVYKTKREKEMESEQQEARVSSGSTESSTSGGSEDGTPAAGSSAEDLRQSGDGEKALTLPREEVIRRLRSYNDVVTYFGESDWEREQRLVRLESDKAKLEYRKGLRNEFQQQLKEVEAMQDETKEEQEERENSQRKKAERMEQLMKCQPKTKQEKVYVYFKRLLFEWEEDLAKRPEQEQRSTQGKRDLVAMRQAEEYMKPLFKMLRRPPDHRNALDKDQLEHLHRIIEFLQQKEYVKAHDQYLQMAIGNAPWPIGVTMVGIHERSAREKISSNQIAHVLNDETQRKYIQSVKRLMRYCQTKHPTDPSKTVG